MSNGHWSTSDIDAFLSMYHAGQLTAHESKMLAAILRKLNMMDLLSPRNYQAATGTRVNLVTGEVA